MGAVVLLGPQRRQQTVREALDLLGVPGPVAVVSAGWEEREAEHDELAAHVERPVLNLALFARTEVVFAQDADLRSAFVGRHERLRTLQELYRLRLDHALAAVRELLLRGDAPELLAAEVEDALATVTALDRQHLARVRAVHEEFEERWHPQEHPLLAAARATMARELDECAILAIAGGHVLVLLNRLRLLGLAALAGDRPIVAWSAGAMALTEEVLLFHDHPPQGRGEAEVFEPGLGLAPGLVALPHASARLHLHDQARVGLLARRVAPRRAVALDPGCRATWDGGVWRLGPGTCWLSPDGRLEEPTP